MQKTDLNYLGGTDNQHSGFVVAMDETTDPSIWDSVWVVKLEEGRPHSCASIADSERIK